MKYKDYEFDLSSISKFKQHGAVFYSKAAVTSFIDEFQSVFGIDRTDMAISYILNQGGSVVSEKQIQDAINQPEIIKEYQISEQKRLEDIEKRRKERIVANHSKFFAVHIPEFNPKATFIVPFATEMLPEHLRKEIGTGTASFPANSLLAIIQERLKYGETDAEYIMKKEGFQFIGEGLNRAPEITHVMAAPVTYDILQLSKAYKHETIS